MDVDVDAGLSGRVALVTGANHGIGAATAEALAQAGAAVLATYLRLAPAPGLDELNDGGARQRYAENQQRSADELVAAIRSAGGRAESVEADLADPATPARLFDAAESALGPVEVLVNNAAHGAADTFLPAEHRSGLAAGGDTQRPFTADGYDRHVAVNDRAVGLLMAEFVRRHAARGATWGRIVNVSTDGAAVFPSEVSYGATKYAVESLSRSAAVELGRFGITVNIVSPGPIQTGYISAADEARVVAGTPLGRVGEPADVADVIRFFCSHQARWLSGQILYVGGGWRTV